MDHSLKEVCVQICLGHYDANGCCTNECPNETLRIFPNMRCERACEVHDKTAKAVLSHWLSNQITEVRDSLNAADYYNQVEEFNKLDAIGRFLTKKLDKINKG